MTEPIRLSKRVTELTGCSRREAELYIEGGWVQVNGQVVEEPQARVTHETVSLDPQARPDPIAPATLLWHRPDAQAHCHAAGLHEATEAAPPGQRILRKHFLHQATVAPLEGLCTGLVVFSQDSRILRRLRDDAAQLEEEFMLELPGQLTDSALTDLQARLQEARRWPQVPVVGKISLNARGPQGTRLRFALKASGASQIEALCATAGLKPLSLRRTRLGRVALASLAPGHWRFLGPTERF